MSVLNGEPGFAFNGKVTEMVRIQYRGSSGRQIVSKEETKICPLCATLNYRRNMECFACGWRGAFGSDKATTDFQWQRLTERYEEVRLEHLTAHRGAVIGDFGVARTASLWRRFCTACASGWQMLGISVGRGAASPRKGNTVGQSAGPFES
jgi:hypothetical protein